MNTVKKSLQARTVESMKAAAMEEKCKDEIEEYKAMFDGSWRKHGYTSLQGPGTAISAKTGKCLDYETLNKVCHGCFSSRLQPDSQIVLVFNEEKPGNVQCSAKNGH